MQLSMGTVNGQEGFADFSDKAKLMTYWLLAGPYQEIEVTLAGLKRLNPEWTKDYPALLKQYTDTKSQLMGWIEQNGIDTLLESE